MDDGSACGLRGTAIGSPGFLDFGLRGGCTSSRLDHGLKVLQKRRKVTPLNTHIFDGKLNFKAEKALGPLPDFQTFEKTLKMYVLAPLGLVTLVLVSIPLSHLIASVCLALAGTQWHVTNEQKARRALASTSKSSVGCQILCEP